MLQREFGDNPGTVAAHGVAFIRGMQQAGVATTAKHFPGLGGVRGNTDFTAGVVDTVTAPDDPYLRSRAVDFLAAGGDLITSQTLDAAAAMDRAILGHMAVDAGFRAVVNSAVMRVLSAKQAYGLLPCSRH